MRKITDLKTIERKLIGVQAQLDQFGARVEDFRASADRLNSEMVATGDALSAWIAEMDAVLMSEAEYLGLTITAP